MLLKLKLCDITLQLQELPVNWQNFCCGFVAPRDLIADPDNKKAVQFADLATKLLKEFSNSFSTIVQPETTL